MELQELWSPFFLCLIVLSPRVSLIGQSADGNKAAHYKTKGGMIRISMFLPRQFV